VAVAVVAVAVGWVAVVGCCANAIFVTAIKASIILAVRFNFILK